jgi:hypothetical protein
MIDRRIQRLPEAEPGKRVGILAREGIVRFSAGAIASALD